MTFIQNFLFSVLVIQACFVNPSTAQILNSIVNTITREECRPDFIQALNNFINGADLPTTFRECSANLANSTNSTHPDVGLTTEQVIIRYGYSVSMHSVSTEDNYILTIHRIPNEGRPAVYLQHGIAGSSEDWLMLGEKSLAFLLWNAGYDVWLGNFRGTSYSLGHLDRSWNDPTDFSYWDFSFHELGQFDVPAVIRKIKEVTNNSTLFYVGHSLGTTAMLIAIDQNPVFINENVAAMVFLSTVGFIGRSITFYRLFIGLILEQSLIRLTTTFRGRVEEPLELLEALNLSAANICAPTAIQCTACSYAIFALVGFNANQVDYETIPLIIDRHQNTLSIKTLFHFAQLRQNCNFCQFDYGTVKNLEDYQSATPPCYNLSEARIPVYAFYGDGDILVSPKDSERTLNLLPPGVLQENIRVNDSYYNHMDHVAARDADILEYNHIIDIFERHLN